MNSKRTEFHVWALEQVNVSFGTTHEEQTLTPDRFRMVPRLGCCEKPRVLRLGGKFSPQQRFRMSPFGMGFRNPKTKGES